MKDALYTARKALEQIQRLPDKNLSGIVASEALSKIQEIEMTQDQENEFAGLEKDIEAAERANARKSVHELELSIAEAAWLKTADRIGAEILECDRIIARAG